MPGVLDLLPQNIQHSQEALDQIQFFLLLHPQVVALVEVDKKILEMQMELVVAQVEVQV